MIWTEDWTMKPLMPVKMVPRWFIYFHHALAMNGANAAITAKMERILNSTTVDEDAFDYMVKKDDQIKLLIQSHEFKTITTDLTLTKATFNLGFDGNDATHVGGSREGKAISVIDGQQVTLRAPKILEGASDIELSATNDIKMETDKKITMGQ
jgi:hypothetical protein